MSSSSSPSFDTYVEMMQSFDLDPQVKKNHRERLQPLLHFLKSCSGRLYGAGGEVGKLPVELQREWRQCEAKLATVDAELVDAVAAEADQAEKVATAGSAKLLPACYVDPLTLLHRKASYGKVLKEVSARGQRMQLIIASASVDYFELIKEKWSHAHGDYAIVLAADAIHEEVQKWNEKHCIERKEAHCSAFRFGEDEFVLAFAFCSEKSKAEGRKEALAKALLEGLQKSASERLREEFPFRRPGVGARESGTREGPSGCWGAFAGPFRGSFFFEGGSKSLLMGPSGSSLLVDLDGKPVRAAGPTLSIGVSMPSAAAAPCASDGRRPQAQREEEPVARLHRLYVRAERALEEGRQRIRAGEEPKGGPEVKAGQGEQKGAAPLLMQLLEEQDVALAGKEQADFHALIEEGAVPLLVRFLKDGTPAAKEKAAGALKYLSAYNADNKVLIAREGAVPLLVRLLEDGTAAAKEQAATALRNLSVNADNKVLIGQKGAVPSLVRILEGGTPAAREQAAGALWNLCASNSENKVLVAEKGAVPLLVQLLEGGTAAAKEKAAGALLNLATNAQNQVLIGCEKGAVPLLVRLLEVGTPAARENAAGALQNLATNAHNQVLIGQKGAVPFLVQLLEDGTPAAKEQAAGALWNLSSKNAANKVLIGQTGGVPSLVRLLESGTAAAKENAAGALKSLSANSAEFKVLMGQKGAVPLLVRLLEDGTPMAKENAAVALKMLGHGHKC